MSLSYKSKSLAPFLGFKNIEKISTCKIPAPSNPESTSVVVRLDFGAQLPVAFLAALGAAIIFVRFILDHLPLPTLTRRRRAVRHAVILPPSYQCYWLLLLLQFFQKCFHLFLCGGLQAQFQSSFVVGDGLVKPPTVGEEKPATVVGIGVLRVEVDGLIVVGDGLVKEPFVGVGKPVIIVGKGVLQVEGDGLIVVGDGLVNVPSVGVGKPAIVVGKGKLRVEGDGLVVVGDGAVVVT